LQGKSFIEVGENQQPSHQGHGYVELQIRGRTKKKATGEGFESKLGWAKKTWLSAGSGWASLLLSLFFLKVLLFFSSLAKLLLLFFVLLDAFGTKKGTERGIRKGFRSGFKDFQN
jgi:hypothetical protein